MMYRSSMQNPVILSYPAPPPITSPSMGQQSPPNQNVGFSMTYGPTSNHSNYGHNYQPASNGQSQYANAPYAQPFNQPILQPPMPTNFYPAPDAPNQVPFGPLSNPLIPRGLDVLLTINQLIIEQQTEMLEAFIGYETNNKYIVKNMNGQHLYYAAEKNDLCTRNCLGKSRPFTIKLMDNEKNEIMRFERPWRCTSCLFPCCLQRLQVYCSGQRIGSIIQEWSLFYPQFSVLNAMNEKVLHIKGPFITFSCGGDIEFNILSTDCSTYVGKITKQWSGLAREIFTDADRFGIEFPRDMDVNIKAVLLAATFLIDFMYFERGHR